MSGRAVGCCFIEFGVALQDYTNSTEVCVCLREDSSGEGRIGNFVEGNFFNWVVEI